MLVTFEVAGQEFALELDSVQEILPAPAVVVAVPRAEALVRRRDVVARPPAAAAVAAGVARLSARAGRGRTRESRRHESRRRASRARRGSRESHRGGAGRKPSTRFRSVLAARTGGEARLKAIYRGEQGRRLISILMPEQLFREDVMRRLGQRTERQLASNAQRRAATRATAVSRLPFGRRRVRAADRRRRRSRRSAGADHPLAEDAEVPRGRRESSRRRAARRRPTPPVRHARVERAKAADASSWCEPTAIARA